MKRNPWMIVTPHGTMLSQTGNEYELCETRELAVSRSAEAFKSLMRPPLSLRVDKATQRMTWQEFCRSVFKSMFVDPTRDDLMLGADAAFMLDIEAQRWGIVWDDVIVAASASGTVQ
jgi:hypothetical protein